MDTIYLEKLKLTNFRNYGSLALDLPSRHVVLTGNNGAGKTNILEAISFLSPGRGLRRAPYDTVSKVGTDGGWTVFAQLQGAAGDVSIGTGIQEAAVGASVSRRVQINGAPAKTTESLLDHLRVVWLTPAMDGLFSGPASDRRRFLDRMVLSIDPGHGRRVADFEKTMRSRNKLLAEERADEAWLDATERQLAELGVAIAYARHELVSLLSGTIVAAMQSDSPFPDALISLIGNLENLVNEVAAGDLEDEYCDRLKNGRRLDRAAGRTLEGPHRSDLQIFHRPKAMEARLCSTGEQKALLTGLVLAHTRLVGEMNGHSPVLLLDEIAAHLDHERRAGLYDLLDTLGCQAWMTGTDAELFEALGERASSFHVVDGRVDRI